MWWANCATSALLDTLASRAVLVVGHVSVLKAQLVMIAMTKDSASANQELVERTVRRAWLAIGDIPSLVVHVSTFF